ncbi:MAG: C40 family peptidase [Methylococcales bacterium]|nr:C40 family peptidase [Methylococcales bacterium]
MLFRKYTDYQLSRLLLPLVVVLFSGCASTPEPKTSTVGSYNSTSPTVDYALRLQGAPYRFGKDNPQEGFDCSGFVRHVYEHQGVHLPRTVAEMADALTPVPKNQAHPGDLVFFNTTGKQFSHVGIYVKDNQFVHAPSQRTGRVSVSSLKNSYWEKRFVAVRRP